MNTPIHTKKIHILYILMVYFGRGVLMFLGMRETSLLEAKHPYVLSTP
jgi:hypothetical protein